MKCLVTDAKRRDCFWFHLRLSSLPVDTHWKYKRELKTETRIVWQRMNTRVRFLRDSSEWYESEWLWNQRAWKAWDGSTDGENGNSGAPSSVEPAGGVKELKTPDERLMKEVQIRWPTSVAARKPDKVLISPQTLCDIKLWKKNQPSCFWPIPNTIKKNICDLCSPQGLTADKYMEPRACKGEHVA